MEKEAQDFLDALKKANADDLKKRIVEKAEKIVESAGLSRDRLKEVAVDVSDFLK